MRILPRAFPLFLLVFFSTALTPAFGSTGGELTLDERAACLAAVEQVYWSHRTWPEQNPGAKPALSAVLSADQLYERAEQTLRKSAALEQLWRRPLTAADLQEELDRMARETRRPEVLRELFQALGNDPGHLAECLARPLLAERLLRSSYSQDSRFHGALRAQAQRDRSAWRQPNDLRQTTGSYREVDLPLTELIELFGEKQHPEVGAISALREDEQRFFTAGLLRGEGEHARVALVEWSKRPFDQWWQEVASDFPARIVTSAAETYRLPGLAQNVECSANTWNPLPYSPPALDGHEAVWTGAEMIIWGGTTGFVVAGRYDPATDFWRPISIEGEPLPRMNHTAVWTGTEMIIWGGWGFLSSANVFSNGGRYNPVTDSWTATALAGAPTARTGHTAIWTGSIMVVWGGCPDFGCNGPLATGGRYNPSTNTWSPTSTSGAPEPRSEHTAVWTTTEMIVWGGCGGGFCNVNLNTGGRYNPVADTWAPTAIAGAPEARELHTAVWTGSRMVVWGGCTASADCFSPPGTGGRYDPATNTWAPTSMVGAPEGRRFHIAVWAPTAARMVIWGGCAHAECSSHYNSGARYDPVGDTWSPTSLVNAPTGRSQATAVWTGSEVIVWGGCHSGECQIELNSGGRYNPVSDSWVPTGDPNDPGLRVNHTAVWTGAEMIVWGGFDPGQGVVLTGLRYDPATDSWSGMAFTGFVGARDGHTAVWTGTEMIVWGGRLAGIGTTMSGGRYNPSSDTWVTTNTEGAAVERAFHTAVWTGTEMMVWGGCAFDACDSYRNTGGRYRPATDSWLGLNTAGAPGGRIAHVAVWTGSQMIVWGGFASGIPFGDGARYDPTADGWTSVSATGAPSPRFRHTGIWTGTEFIVWGGGNGSAPLGDGARYNPGANSWTPTATAGAPAARRDHSAVWTGAEMILWGGCVAADCGAFNRQDNTRTGARYSPAANSWTPTSTLRAAAGRSLHTAVWTGSEMIAWGGWQGSSATIFSTGARYCAGPITPVPNISVAPNPLNFGMVAVGGSANGTVTVSNTGSASLTITSVTSPAPPFAKTSDGCAGQVVVAGGNCAIGLTFSPTTDGSFNGNFTINSNDPDQAVVTVNLVGQGATVVLAPAALAIVDAGANGMLEPGEAAQVRPSWRNTAAVSANFVTGSAVADSTAILTDSTATYGPIPAGATRSCAAMTDCYGLTANGPRPSLHWDISLNETVSTGDSHPWPVHVGQSFSDVPPGHPFARFVETILHHGVTAGCGSGNFCPGAPATRAQMSIFLLRAALGPAYQPPACIGRFADVPCPSPFANWIEDLYVRSITAGCGTDPLRFCPDAPATRAQIAVFLLLAREGSGYTPPPCNGVFDDVPCPSSFAPWIEELFNRGVTAGCSTDPPRYCPEAPTTRGQMSVFLTTMFGLQLYAP